MILVNKKIVKHIAHEAQVKVSDAIGEAFDMCNKYPSIFADKSMAGPGLDMAVLRDKLADAYRVISLLAQDR